MNKSKFSIFSLVFFVITGLVFLVAKTTFAQNSLDQAINKYSINFPITELGNCENFSSCHNFCEDPVNKNACISYAKKKGFYKKEEIDKKKDQILAAAQSELGCNSITSCKSFCENEANFEKCTEFAKKHDLGGGQILSPKNQEILAKAKSILGCDSPSACKALCEKPENHQKCGEFAKQAGLQGGEEFRGPGGCSTPETCETYCSEPGHRQECAQFGPGPEEPEGPPCFSEEECQDYCQNHPDDCKEFGYEPPEEHPRGPSETDEFCRQYPERCLDEGPDYESGEDFCRDHPEACPGPGSLDPETKEGQDFCQEHPEDCQDIEAGEGWVQEFENEFDEGFNEMEPPSVEEPEPTVQGISTIKSLWQIILEFFFDR